MIVAHPLPDEFCRGHVGRIQMLNGFQSFACTVRAIRLASAESKSERGQASALDATARLCGILTPDYAHLHSFLPYTSLGGQVVEKKVSCWVHTVQVRSGMTSPREHAYFCESCVKEDREFHGFSYWRRSHQLPGMLWCHKHWELLKKSSLHNPFETSPFSSIQASVPCSDAFGKTYVEAPDLIRRFIDASNLLLDQRASVHMSEVKARLIEQARLLKLHHSEKGRRVRLSDAVKAEFPFSWLTEVFPKFGQKRDHQFFSAIDSAVMTAGTRPPTESIAMAIALMFESTEDGASYVTNKSRQAPKLPLRRLSLGRDVSLSEAFIECGGNPQKIAETLSVREENVQSLLARKKAQLLKDLQGNVAMKAVQEFLTGATLEAACQSSKASPAVVEALLRVMARFPGPQDDRVRRKRNVKVAG